MNTWFVYKRELKTYFASPFAYVLTTGFLLLTGIIFWINVQGFAVQSQRAAGQQFGQFPSIQNDVIGPIFFTMAFFFLFIVPLITMRLFAEEERAGTMEMLLTFPLQEHQVIFGKFFAALTVVAMMLAFTALYPGFIASIEDVTLETRAILAAYLGIFLLGAVFVGIGIFMSSLVENQVIAGFASFGLMLILWIVSSFGFFIEIQAISDIVNHLSLTEHLRSFLQGVIETKSVIYYLEIIVLTLFLTYISIQSKRWRA